MDTNDNTCDNANVNFCINTNSTFNSINKTSTNTLNDKLKDSIKKDIIGLSYDKTIIYFSELNNKMYFRPVQMDNVILWKDNDYNESRCNILFENNKVIQIDGWY